MSSKVLRFLLSLSLIFCVGFGSSVSASAAYFDVNALQWTLLPFNYFLDGQVEGTFDTVSHTYNANSSIVFNNDTFISYIVGYNEGASFPIIENGHTYLLYYNVSFPSTSSFSVIDIGFEEMSYVGKTRILESSYIDAGIASTSGIYQFTAENSFSMNTASALVLNLNKNFTSTGRQVWAFYILDVTENTQQQIDSIITAINNQTNSLGSAIGGAADQITGSIEDQYSGDPGSSLPVDDIITQHNEKMGVLSFGSDTLMQVLGLLSPDQSLSSELVFPSMSLTIAGQRNKVQLWPEYRFDLNELKQHWPDFIGLMQSLTTALVWIFVLRYCYRVFEKYFLAGGGN